MAKSAVGSSLGAWIPEELRGLLTRRELQIGRPVRGRRQGPHRSRRAGPGRDFLEHRPYLPGDDLRQLDWRAVARRDRLVVRRTESEDELPVALLFDLNGGMGFRHAQSPSKLDVVRGFAAAIAELARRQRDPIGFALAQGEEVDASSLPPSSSRERHAALGAAFAAMQAAKACPWEALLHAASTRLQRPGLLFVFSDLLDPSGRGTRDAAEAATEAVLEGLTTLRGRGHVVVLVQVLHDAELRFPWEGDEVLRFEDLRGTRPSVEGSGNAMRDAYLEALGDHLAALRTRCETEGLIHASVIAGRPLSAPFIETLERIGARAPLAPIATGPGRRAR